MNNQYVISVSQINSYIENSIVSDAFLNNVAIKGEIVELNYKYRYVFLTLKDSQSSLDCIIPDSVNYDQHVLQIGNEVIATGSIGLYNKNARIRLKIDSVSMFGEGDYLKSVEQLKHKLESEGIFDNKNKKRIPEFPEHIGIITSESGAAVHDIINIAKRRNTHIRLSLYPVKVQGNDAAPSMINAILYYNQYSDADLIIIGRGGGNILDLSPFNDEKLVRAVYSSKIPVISAVGHQIDFTLTDFAADLRAPTPSAAAEIAVPELSTVSDRINSLFNSISLAYNSKYDSYMNVISVFEKSKRINPVINKISDYKKMISLNRLNQIQILKTKMDVIENRYAVLVKHLENANPESLLSRGFSYLEHNNIPVKSIMDIDIDDIINIKLKDGNIKAIVKGKVPDYEE